MCTTYNQYNLYLVVSRKNILLQSKMNRVFIINNIFRLDN